MGQRDDDRDRDRLHRPGDHQGLRTAVAGPIGMGVIVGNIPVVEGMSGVMTCWSERSIRQRAELHLLRRQRGIYPPLIFLGIGAMTDFSTMLSNPKLTLLGAAAQIGVFLTFLGSLYLGFDEKQAGAIGIIGGADGPTAIFLAAKLAPELARCDRDRRLLLHGAGAGHPTADHAVADDARRTFDSHEAAAESLQT